MADITMPQLGETVTEGTITRWAKQVGDQVAEDEVLFEVSTDKVDSEVPSPASGYVTEILVPEGDTVEVGVRLAVIGDSPPAGGDAGAAAPAEPAAAEPAAAEPAAAAAESESAEPAAAAPEAEAGDTPAERATKAEASGAPEQAASAAASAGETEAASVPASAPSAAPTGSGDGGDAGAGAAGKVLSPVVRRLISEHGLDPNQITGSGAGGRITRADVLSVIDAKGGAGGRSATPPTPAPAAERTSGPAEQVPAPKESSAAPAPQQAATAPTPPPAGRPSQEPAAVRANATTVTAGARDEVVPFTNIRRRTAEHMVRSKATSAHTLIVIEVDYAAVDAVRLRVKDAFKAEEGVSLTYLPFVARAVVDAIRDFPHVNASVGDDELIVHHDIHLGIAVDLNLEGLLVPVIKGADDKRLRAIARDVADLAGRARSKRLGMDDIAGGTFTITNPGPFGSLVTFPIINQPQVAILSTDGVKKRPVVITAPDGSDAIAIHPTGNLCLSFDHRVVDGAYAAAFLARTKEILEGRDWQQEL